MKQAFSAILFFAIIQISYSQIHFKIETDQGWQNTGYTFIANQPIAFAIMGYNNNDADANNRRFNYFGPTGNINAGGTNLPLESAPPGSIIAKIGENGNPFGLGEFVFFADGGHSPLTESGDIFVRINDNDGNLFDNDGTFILWIIPLISVDHYKVITDQGWQNSGAQITANEPLTIRAIGYCNNNADQNNRRFNYFGPAGDVAYGGSNLPLESAPPGSLIGKIGVNGNPFGIGEFVFFADGGQNPLNEDGELYLRVNDHDGNLFDNDGTFFTWIMHIDNTLTLSEIPLQHNITISPNPAKDKINISIESNHIDNYNIEVFNIYGQLVYLTEVTFSNNKEINISDFSTGSYFVYITNSDGIVIATDKFIKN